MFLFSLYADVNEQQRHAKDDGDLAGVRVVVGFPGGSPDVASSRDRVEGFTKQLRDQFKVEIVSSIDELLAKVDVVLLESVDGRPHLSQVIPVLKAGKPATVTGMKSQHGWFGKITVTAIPG